MITSANKTLIKSSPSGFSLKENTEGFYDSTTLPLENLGFHICFVGSPFAKHAIRFGDSATITSETMSYASKRKSSSSLPLRSCLPNLLDYQPRPTTLCPVPVKMYISQAQMRYCSRRGLSECRIVSCGSENLWL